MRRICLQPITEDVDLFDTYHRDSNLLNLKNRMEFPTPLRHPLQVISPPCLHFNEAVSHSNRLRRIDENRFLVFGSHDTCIVDLSTSDVHSIDFRIPQETVILDAYVKESDVVLFLLSDGSLVSSSGLFMRFIDACCIDAVLDEAILIRICPAKTVVKFLLVDIVNQVVREEFESPSNPKHVTVCGKSVILAGPAPVWSTRTEERPDIDDEGYITRIEVFPDRVSNITHYTSQNPVLSNTGEFLALGHFVDSAAVLCLPEATHLFTFPGIQYIAESRQQLKFLAVSQNYTVMCASQGTVAVFKKPSPGAQTSESASLQDYASDDIIMGVHLANHRVLIFTEHSFFIYS